MVYIVVIFLVGYLLITLEHTFNMNKAGVALLSGVLCWTVYISHMPDPDLVTEQLTHHLSEISAILFFLLGAMTIVEVIDMHDGFEVIVKRISTGSKNKLLWIFGLLAFFLSAILDNLTTTIVLVSILKKLVPNKGERLFYAGLVIIAANAGGAFTPIGDVTTTMLWIGGQISTTNIIKSLFLPSLACLLAPLLFLSFKMKGQIEKQEISTYSKKLNSSPFERRFVLFMGVSALVFVPVFKLITHLPPYMGILLGLGALWMATEIIHHKKDEEHKSKFSVLTALRKVDTSTVLFFMGILLSIGAMQSAGQLTAVASFLDEKVGNYMVINFMVGLFSAVVDNVPLVAAMMRMYGADYPMDHTFWNFLAYCAGTGGSILIIGSAAGVAVMGMEKVEFFWYFKKISLLAFVGYAFGAVVFVIQQEITTGEGMQLVQKFASLLYITL